jgi:hypothetical protein
MISLGVRRARRADGSSNRTTGTFAKSRKRRSTTTSSPIAIRRRTRNHRGAVCAEPFHADGANTLLGLTHDILADGWTSKYQWLTCDLTALSRLVAQFELSGGPEAFSRDLLYASPTRDAVGRHYVVGMAGYSRSYCAWSRGKRLRN